MTPPEAPFDEPWQAQAFALVVHLHAAGAFTWSEWATALAGEIAAHPDAPYYEAWLAALERLTTEKRLATSPELTRRKDEWEHAYLHTPHGKPVELHTSPVRVSTDIDEALMANVTGRWRKVAMVIVLSADALSWTSDDDLERLAKHLETLVADGKLEAQGNIRLWRHSEVRLPSC